MPRHYAQNIAGAMVEKAHRVILETGIVPGYLHQYAEMWEAGLSFGSRDENFWHHVVLYERRNRRRVMRILDRATNCAPVPALASPGE